MRSLAALAAVVATLAPSAMAALPTIPPALVWKFAPPRSDGVRSITVTVRCGNGFAVDPFWIRRGATAAALVFLRSERARVASGAYGFSGIASACSDKQRAAPASHLSRLFHAHHLFAPGSG